MCELGRFFTPPDWACWLVRSSGAFDIWRDGGTVLDPTCGDGSFLEAFIVLGRKEGCLDADSLGRIYGNEIVVQDKAMFLARMEQRYDLRFPACNFTTTNFFERTLQGRFDCVIGNPPWANFTDIPEHQKEEVKSAFRKYGLVVSKKDVLLGNSRADVASLVVQKSLEDNLVREGTAAFWLPKSIFFNESANRNLRAFRTSRSHFCCKTLHVFDGKKAPVFPRVSTSYCAAVFKADCKQNYPVQAYRYLEDARWVKTLVSPPENDDLGGWKEDNAGQTSQTRYRLHLHASQKPRQGINTCGANDVFMFEHAEELGLHERRLTNGLGQTVVLPKALTFPLVTRHTFKGQKEPARWIFLPYDKNSGRPLKEWQLETYVSAKSYLEGYRDRLVSRKGVLIGSLMSKGLYWQLMGIGPYSFAPWKVIWEAYGKKEFRPILIQGDWQANQAMQAFIPCWTLAEAHRVIASLGKMDIQSELLRHGMEGTMNWAQPGRISRLIQFSSTGRLAE